MSTCKTVKTWSKTNVGNLVKHRSGGYYARLFIGGKERWRSLKTTVMEVAKVRLREEQTKAGKVSPKASKLSSAGRMTAGQALSRIADEAKLNVAMPASKKVKVIKASSAHYRGETIDALRKSWRKHVGEELDSTELRKITNQHVLIWTRGFDATASASRFNNTLGTLRRIFEIGIEAGEIHSNPARQKEVGRSRKRAKSTYLPKLDEFRQIVATVRASGTRYALDAAEYIEFLGYSGARKDEAARLAWRDVDLARATVTFRHTKNGEPRTNALIPEARACLQAVATRRGQFAAEDEVFNVSEAYGSLRAAAKIIGIPRISHHDLRDMFATECIRRGADIPTVAQVLGHKDNGKTLLDFYMKNTAQHQAHVMGGLSFS